MATPQADLKRLGRYDIVSVLGKGAMGVVYAGMDPRLHRKVAIKTILKSSLDEDTAREYTMRFDREAQAVARLNHPNIVQVYDFGAEGEVAYIVMEFIQGKELKDFFDANERFDIKEAVHIMGELCEALHFAHEAGIIHRDIKPANVMIDNKGRVKLADFGVARITDADRSASEKTQAGAIVGTPAYMSPEQIEGGEIDRRTDIFSTGIILYQFLTGEKPFTGTSTWTIAKKILQDEPVMPSRLNTNISPLFDAIIKKALAKNMNARYQNARDLGADLKNALEGKATTDDSDKTVVGSLKFDASMPPAAIAATPAGASGSHAGQTGTQEVELEFWRSIKDGNDADDFDLYVKQFPDGIYAALAKRKSAKLRGVSSEETATRGAQAAAEQEKRELEEAARREAEVKAKLAEEKAKLEAELAKREADYQKRTAENEAKRDAEAKARAEKEAAEKAEFEAKLAKREADLQVQLKKQEEELKKNEEELKKKAAETAHLTKEIRKKKGSPLVPVAIGLLVAAIGGGSLYYFTRSPDTQALMAALEVAKKSNEQLIQARQGEQQAMKELEEAKKREAEAKASGDVAKQQQLAEETRQREAEVQRQGELVKQREAEAKAAVAKAEAAATKAKEGEKEKLEKAKADKVAADRAAVERVAADKAAAEKAAADQAAAAERAAAEKVAAAKVAPTAPVAPKPAAEAPKPAAEAPKPKITASTGAAERLLIREEEAARKAAEARAASGTGTAETKSGAGEQVASVAPSLVDPAAPKVSLFQQGKAAESSGNIKGAVRLYVRAVRAGEFDAAKALGDIFAEGKGDVTKDYAESLKYYAIAEKNGVKLERSSGRGR
jgi:serine/threonine protein kinase